MEGYDVFLTNLNIKDVVDTGGLFGSTQSPTVTVSINDQSFSTVRARHGRTEAKFTEEFVFHLLSSIAIDDQKIQIGVFNESSKGVKTSIGSGEISLRDLLKVPPDNSLPLDGSAHDIMVTLTHMMKNNKEHNKGMFSAHVKVQFRSSDTNAPSSLLSAKEGISSALKNTDMISDESNPVDKIHSTTIDTTTETPRDTNSKTVKPDENILKDSDRDRGTHSVIDNPKSSEGAAMIKSTDTHSTNTATIPEIKAVAEKEPSLDVIKEISPIKVDATASTLASTHSNTKNTDVSIQEPVSGNQSLTKKCHVVLSKLSVTTMMQGQGDILGDEITLSIQIGDETKSTRVSQDLVSQELSFSLWSDPNDVHMVASLRSDIIAQENLSHLFPTLDKPVAFTLYLSEVKSSPPPLQQLSTDEGSEPSTPAANIYARLDGMGVVTFGTPEPAPQPVEKKEKKAKKGESIRNEKSGGRPVSTIEKVKVESTNNVENQDIQKEAAQSGNNSNASGSIGDSNATTIGIAVSDSPSVGAAKPGQSDQVSTVTAAATAEASTAAIAVATNSGLGLSSKSKRLIAEADGSIGRHRKAYNVTDPVVNAIKIQALWRGKRIRRILRRQNTAAIIIQRIVRGNLTRWTEGNSWIRAKVYKELKGESNARLRRIRQRERSLHMLRSLPAKDVGDLTRLEQQRAASTIQRIWRSGRDARIQNPIDRSSRSSKSSVRNPGYAFIVKKFAKLKEKSGQPDLQEIRTSKADIGSEEDVALTERKAKLQEYIQRNLMLDTSQPNPVATDKLSINPEPNLNIPSENDRVYQNTHEYRVEVDALKLAQLQRRIKEAAAKKFAMKDKQPDLGRVDLNSTIGHVDRDDREGARFGARRKYQQMLEEQQKATILLQEHFAAAEEMIQRQVARQDTLGHCQYLVKQLTSPLSLDEAVEALQDIKEQPNNESNWFRRDYLGKYPVHEKKRFDPDPADSSSPLISRTYIDAHFQTVAALRRDRQCWGSVIVPYNDIYNNPEMQLGSDGVGVGLQMNAKNSFLANVANVNVKLSKSIDTFADPFSSRHKATTRHGRPPLDPQARSSTDRAPAQAVGGGGSDLEDSLYWISYATQPSHVNPFALNNDQASMLRGADHPDRDGATNRDKGDGRSDADPNQYLLNKLNPTQEQRQLQHADLRTQISTEVISASLRKDRIKQQCSDDYNKVNRLASLYQNEILNILEKENRIRAQQDMTEQEKQIRLNAAVRIQAAIRGKTSRMHTAGLKAQRRVITALQVLLKEIGYAENTKQRMDSRNVIPSYKPNSMDPNIILGSIRRNLVDNSNVYTSSDKPQQVNRQSKDTAPPPQTTLLPAQSSRTPQKSVHYEAPYLLSGSSGGIMDKLGHPPVVRNLTFSPSTSNVKLATDYSRSNLEDLQYSSEDAEGVHSFHGRVPSIALDQPNALSPRNVEQPSLTPIRNPSTEFLSPDAHPTLAESNSNLLGSGGSANLSVYSPAQGELTGYISSPSQSHNTLTSSLSHSGAYPNPTNQNLTSTQSTNNHSSKKSLLAREPTLKEADNENDSDSESPHRKKNQYSLMSPTDRTNSSIEQVKVALMSVPAGSGWQGKQQEDQVRLTMEKVEDLFRRNSCSVETYLPSALIADVARFNKDASYRILDNLVMVCGVHFVGQFLQRFVQSSSSSPNAKPTSNPNPSTQSSSSSAVVLMGEVEVETAAMVLVQLSTELGVLSLLFSSDHQEGDYTDLTLTECVTQLCILLRLLGSGSSSGLVSIAEVISLLEDRWMRGVNLPHDAERATHEIALCRYRLLLKATRLSSSSVKVLDDAVEAIVEENRRSGNRTKADILTFADIQSIIETWLSTERGSLTSELAAAIGRLCQINPNPNPNSVTVTQLRLFLCRLRSFRALQMRIQVWFRAVPTMYLSLLQMLHTMHPNLSAASPSSNTTNKQAKKSSIVSRSVFIRACQQSELPLCTAEVIMLAELLSRRRNVDPGSKSSSKKESSEADDMVDISMLNLIKKGELLNAPLS